MNRIAVVILMYLLSSSEFFAQTQIQNLVVLEKLGHRISLIEIEEDLVQQTNLNIEKKYLASPYKVLYDETSKNLIWLDDHIGSVLNFSGDRVFEDSLQVSTTFIDMVYSDITDAFYLLDISSNGIYVYSNTEKAFSLLKGVDKIKPIAISFSNKSNTLFILDSNTNDIIAYDVNSDKYSILVNIKDSKPVRIIADDLSRKIYWTSDVSNSINSVNYDGRDEKIIFDTGIDSSPFGISIDNIGNIYWTDYKKGTVNMYSQELMQNQILIDGLTEPIDIESYLGEKISPRNMTSKLFRIYPNPTSDYLYVELENSSDLMVDVQLLDLNGRVLREESINKNTFWLDMQNYKSGVYVLRVISEGKVNEELFVVTNH